MKWLTEYKRSLKMVEVEEIIDLTFYRPLAFLLVKLIYNTRVTPDQLTLSAIITGLIAGFFYSLGSQLNFYMGAIFLFLFVILDCSDGQLARLKKNGTKIGRLLDGIADYVVTTAVFIGIAIGYSYVDDHPYSILFVLTISAICIIIQQLLVDFYRTRFLDIVLMRKNTFEDEIKEYRTEYIVLKNQKGRWLEKRIIHIYLIYSKVQRNLTSRGKREKFRNADPHDYYNKNKLIIRFWVFMGPSAMRTALIICSLIGRFDMFFWLIVVGFNFLVVFLWIIQRQINKSFISQT
jgi:phosphatidylglycerophosphate synthase